MPDDDATSDTKVEKKWDPRNFAHITGGHPMTNAPVQRKGKWAESDKDKGETYPPVLGGDGGHMISRKLAEYIAGNYGRLFNYQGEDTSLGIWANEAPFHVLSHRDKRMTSTPSEVGYDCQKNSKKLLMGHKFEQARIRLCYKSDLEVGFIANVSQPL